MLMHKMPPKRLLKCPRLEKAMETWQLNAIADRRLTPKLEGKKDINDSIGTTDSRLNKNVVPVYTYEVDNYTVVL